MQEHRESDCVSQAEKELKARSKQCTVERGAQEFRTEYFPENWLFITEDANIRGVVCILRLHTTYTLSVGEALSHDKAVLCKL